jgi:hypothetical protein
VGVRRGRVRGRRLVVEHVVQRRWCRRCGHRARCAGRSAEGNEIVGGAVGRARHDVRSCQLLRGATITVLTPALVLWPYRLVGGNRRSIGRRRAVCRQADIESRREASSWGWATPAGGSALRYAGPKQSNGLRMPPNSDSGPSHNLARSLTASRLGCKLAYKLLLTSNSLSSKPKNAQSMISCVSVHLDMR